MTKNFSTRRISKHSCYTTEELAQVLKCSIFTVHNARKDGLPSVDSSKPYLYHGANVISYFRQKREARRWKLSPGTFYCFRCKTPQFPEGRTVVANQSKQGAIRLSGECETCGCGINRSTSQSKLDGLKAVLTIHLTK